MTDVLQALKDAAAYGVSRGIHVEICHACHGIKLAVRRWDGEQKIVAQFIVPWIEIENNRNPSQFLCARINELNARLP